MIEECGNILDVGWNKYPNTYSNTSKNGASFANCWDSEQKTEDLGIKRPPLIEN